MTADYKAQIERGMELLKLCQKLQSAQDGIDRPEPFVIDKSKTLDQFAMDIGAAITNMASLHKLMPMMLNLAKVGRQLEAGGKIKVEPGDDYSTAALSFFMAQNGLS